MQNFTFIEQRKKVTPENILDAVQQAIEIEIATIPTYLYTYYTIRRTPEREPLTKKILSKLESQSPPVTGAGELAKELCAEILVFANKAGALIMSVAVEEMLHMALSSNLKKALGGRPELTGKSPAAWPAYLPGHEPKFWINKAKLSLDQLMTFLKIESPDPISPEVTLYKKTPFDYTTIGEFYTAIENCLEQHPFTYHHGAGHPQLVPAKGYYAADNVDTIYYNKMHEPRFVNATDSGDLVHVTDLDSAKKAIGIIKDQGEGSKKFPGWDEQNKLNCALMPEIAEDKDDAGGREMSHFAKFAQCYCRYQRLAARFLEHGISNEEFSSYFVTNVAANPVTADYPTYLQPVSTLLNAVYTYIFVMTEACYRNSENNTQYEIFMFGIHKSMIWILNSLCGDIMGVTYTGPDGNLYSAAPTFEDYTFGSPASPKAQLLKLFAAAVASYPSIAYLLPRFEALPDVPLQTN